ncbi:hypothetical protein KAT24_02380 [Candidatus Pacearchaeota archaeon]|nr:hypothetical protein [Candidatus Pacearchaeota archaeon]
MIQQGDVVGYVAGTQGCTPKNIQKNIFTKGKGFRDVVLEDVLKMFVGKGNVELVRLPAHLRSQINKTDNKEKISKVAIAQTIDLTAYKIINALINKNVKNLEGVAPPVESKIIKPLYLFLDEEVLLYAKLRRLKHKKIKERKTELMNFINELEIKHPEVKRAIVNSYLALR